jgi:hypothetical protein
MYFNLDKFVKRPSFYFLASQGALFLLAIFATSLVAWGYYILGNNSIYLHELFFLFAFLCILPFIIFYSFINYCILAIFRKTSLLFSNGYFFAHFILFIIANIFLENPAIFEGNGAGIGLVMVWVICINLITILAPLFVLCPYLVLLFLDKKCANNICETPFCQNKLYLGTILFSIAFFIISIAICIYTFFSNSGIGIF